jgi:hypothetical protein
VRAVVPGVVCTVLWTALYAMSARVSARSNWTISSCTRLKRSAWKLVPFCFSQMSSWAYFQPAASKSATVFIKLRSEPNIHRGNRWHHLRSVHSGLPRLKVISQNMNAGTILLAA